MKIIDEREITNYEYNINTFYNNYVINICPRQLLWVLLNRAPSSTTYIHLHPAPPSSTHVYPTHFNLHPASSTSTQLHPPLRSPFQPPHRSLQYPQQYSNQNIARNWAISPNLGRKIKSCPF